MGHVGQDGFDFLNGDFRVRGGAEGKPEETDTGAGVIDTVTDEAKFRPGSAPGHFQKLKPVVDGPDGRYQIVTNTAADEGGDVGAALHSLGPTFERCNVSELNSILAPGMRVEHPDHPEWGIGQVQSNIGGKITVNFPNEGKLVLDGARVSLIPIFDH